MKIQHFSININIACYISFTCIELHYTVLWAVVAVIVWYVGFTTTYAISAYHHWCYEFNLDLDEVYNIMWSSLSVTCDRLLSYEACAGK